MLYHFLRGCPCPDKENSKWCPQIHPPCVPLQPPVDERWSLYWLQGNENVQYNSAAYCSEIYSDKYNRSLVSQPKNLSNEDPTIYVAVNNQRRHGSGFMTPSHVGAKCSLRAKRHRPNCPSPPGDHTVVPKK